MIYHMPSRPALALLSVLGLLACGPSEYITVTDYEQSCRTDDECVLIIAGDPCESCFQNVAINKSELASYAEDLADIDCGGVSLYCPPSTDYAAKPACRKGRCEAVPVRDNGL